MDTATATSVVSAIIAGLSLLLSIYTLYIQRRDLRSRLNVDPLIFSALPRSNDRTRTYTLTFAVSNIGHRSIYVSHFLLAIPPTLTPLDIEDVAFPLKLESGEKIRLKAFLNDEQQQWVKAVAESLDTQPALLAFDGSGNTHTFEEAKIIHGADEIISLSKGKVQKDNVVHDIATMFGLHDIVAKTQHLTGQKRNLFRWR